MTKIFLLFTSLLCAGVVYGGTYYVFCDEKTGRGYQDEKLTKKFPPAEQADADNTCSLPAAVDHSVEAYKSSKRCLNEMKSKCELGKSGGGEGVTSHLKPHDVPGGGWFVVDVNEGSVEINGKLYDQLRCQCGCFTKETNILTTKGYLPIGELLNRSKEEFIKLNSLSLDNEFTVTDFLLPKNFTIGPEDKPILGIYLENGSYISVTEGHPMVIFSEGRPEMVQAKALKNGDSLITEKGVSTKIVSIKSFKIPSTDNVYNIDVGLENWRQKIVVANGIKTGDVKWQHLLSSNEQRAKILSDLTK